MFILGISLISFSIPLAVYLFLLIQEVANNPYMRYANGITEEKLFLWIALCIILACIGLGLIFFSLYKKKNKDMLKSIENRENKSYCKYCNVNVVSSNGVCPICKRSLKGVVKWQGQ